MRTILLPIALVAAALGGGLVGAGVTAAVDDDGVSTTVAAPTRAVAAPSSLAELYEQVAPSVVEVQVEPVAGFEPFEPPQQGGTGTGWVYDADGHIVTNEHVVDGAETVQIRFHDGTEANARVVATDASTDVAVLELTEDSDADPLELGSSDALRVGDPVVAIGSPFGLEGSLTSGIISGLGRSIQAPDGFTIDGAVQTDAALNPGNSGGPLLDGEGRVVGMNAQIASQSGSNVGVGYAIPIDTVRSIVGQLLEDGEVRHPYLGVRIADADDGARIAEVVDGGPADDAGLRVGDVVIEAGGEAVDTADELRLAVAERAPGDELELQVRRGGDTREITVELGTRPTEN